MSFIFSWNTYSACLICFRSRGLQYFFLAAVEWRITHREINPAGAKLLIQFARTCLGDNPLCFIIASSPRYVMIIE